MDRPTPPAGLNATVVVTLDVGVRQIELEQIANLEALIQKAIAEESPNPYWGYLWPSARTLAEYIGRNLDFTQKRVLDLGCGLGALGVVAALKGGEVTMGDECAEAVGLAARNAARNGQTARTLTLNWNQPPDDLGQFDVVVASDVLYEDGMLGGVLRFLRKHLAPGGTAYVADPMRIAPAGIAGAARLHGMVVTSEVLSPGHTMSRGVTLHRVTRRS